ncbi:MAG: wax ester/triacylglycerol synthase family O-acyltransferase, partial [Deltaproteobacteria bacterium]|nr:wax ester/triacylglycerol synthase family O-acyltransferase [Deltaproteobacteria bacterium]
MARYNYDRLSDQDNNFLLWERPGLPMHLAGLQIFKAGPLLNEHGGIDFDKVRKMTIATLHRVPRYRQKLAWVPRDERAVWVDDAHFNPDYHIRHTSLPRPGTDERLKSLMGRIMAQPLDRSKPLWELWVIEGLEGDRFATILKTHHCIIDGSAGVDLASRLFSTDPDARIPKAPAF